MSARKGRSRRAFTGDGDLGIPQALSREAAFRGLRSGTGLGTGSGSFPQPGGPVSPQLRGGRWLGSVVACRLPCHVGGTAWRDMCSASWALGSHCSLLFVFRGSYFLT